MNIYIIKNSVNDKVYIGQTCHSIYQRFSRHKLDCYKKEPTFINNKFYRAMREIGPEKFYIELLEDNISTFEELDKREIYWIDKYHSYENGYNSTPGGQGYRPNYNDKEILSYWDMNYSMLQIAQELRLDRETVKRSLERQGITNLQSHAHQTIYSDKQLLEWWNEGLGISQIHNLYGGCNKTIKRRLLNNHISESEILERAHNNQKIAQKNNAQSNNHPVYQFSLTGELLNQFVSIKEASEKTGTLPTSISHCLKGEHKQANNYIWLDSIDENQIINKIEQLKITNKRTVLQFDLNMNFIAEHDSIAAATRAVNGKSASSISTACNRGGGMSYGYYWKFKV